MNLVSSRIGETSVFLGQDAEGDFTVVAVTGNRFGFSVFAPDEEETARACYANTVRAACRKAEGA